MIFLILIMVFILILILLKIYFSTTMGICKSKRQMDGKVCIITGSNSGIGKETARDLARRGARVIMACRNLQLANAAKDDIVADTGNLNVIVHKLDLSNFNSVREFADIIKRTESRLDVLIHNAGIFLGDNKSINSDGIELTFATNHLGSFLLTHLLIDLLKQSEPCRIVINSSTMGLLNFKEFENFDHKTLINRNSSMNYIFSKHCNILFMRELGNRLQGTNITVNSLNPGSVATNITSNADVLTKLFLKLTRTYRKSPEEGAQTQIFLSVSEDVDDVSGVFFSDCKPWNSVCRSQSELKKSKILWELSKELVNLKPEEKNRIPPLSVHQ